MIHLQKTIMKLRWSSLLLTFLLLFIFSHCKKRNSSCEIGEIVMLAGNNQVGKKNESLSQKVKIRATDISQTPLIEQAIGIKVYGGGCIIPIIPTFAYFHSSSDTINYYIVYSDSNGDVEFNWILGKEGSQSILPVFHNIYCLSDADTPVFFATFAPLQLGFMTDSRDGNQYDTTQIGTQIWMAENLRYESQGSSSGGTKPLLSFGRKYNWTEAQSLCPIGWHLPSDTEWNVLESYLGMDTISRVGDYGEELKSVSGWGLSNGNNNTHFNAYPTMAIPSSGFGSLEIFWTATDSISRILGSNHNGIGTFPSLADNYHSCRCIKN